MKMIALSYHLGMTLDQLLAFRAVAARGTFAAAALELHKSQPAVSKLVQNLEAELGIVLFDRSAYRATLTDAGRIFFERTEHVLAETDSLRALALSLSGKQEPVVRLVLEAITPLEPVLRALSEVQALFPTVRFELRTERQAGTREALEDGSSDLSISSQRKANTVAEPFCDVRVIPVVRSDHALAKAEAPVPARLLRGYPQVILSDSARGEPAPDVNVLEGGHRWSVTDVAAKLQIIEAGLGWGGLPEHVVKSRIATGALVTLTVRAFDVAVIELYTMRRKGKTPGPVVQALWGRLRRGSQE